MALCICDLLTAGNISILDSCELKLCKISQNRWQENVAINILFFMQFILRFLLLCVCRPNTGTSPFEEEKSDLLNKYISIPSEDAGS